MATHHWADQAALRTLETAPANQPVVVAAGITPSGVVHVGNFREVITVDLVARALRDRGANVRFIYSWDDFDVFRKVPADAPAQELLTENLGRSIADVPDPWGEHDSYASHHIAAFEGSLGELGIAPEFIRQHRRYRAGVYAEGIRAALVHADTIRNILNDSRRKNGAKSLIDDDWLPISGFCDACGRDDLDIRWDGEWTLPYTCRACGHAREVDLRQGGNIKLPWRIDWPMRWGVERVAFEPGGKDHSSAGGSYDTAKDIVREIYGWTAPQYVGYDFVSIKGQGGKISSSKGGVITVADCLEVYEPEVLRWLFASYRPNTEFAISFDLDVVKIYEDYDRAVRTAHEADDGSTKDKKRQQTRRAVEFSLVVPRAIVPGSTPPELIPFRHVSTLLQTFDGDIAKTKAYLQRAGSLVGEDDARRFEQRAQRVWFWIETYAPPDFRYRIRSEPVTRSIQGPVHDALRALVHVLETQPELDETGLGLALKRLTADVGLDGKVFFPVVYDLLLDRDQGPKLGSLLVTMGAERALPLLRPTSSSGPSGGLS